MAMRDDYSTPILPAPSVDLSARLVDRVSPAAPPVSSTEEMVAERAQVYLSAESVKALLGPCVYATFRADGRCHYVGSSRRGLARPFGHDHYKLRTGRWDRLVVWSVSALEDLDRLERAAIQALSPSDCAMHGAALRIQRKKPKREYYTTREIAQKLRVTTKFVLGEIQDGRMGAIKLERPSGRAMYRVSLQDFTLYMMFCWRPVKGTRATIGNAGT